MHLLPIQNRTLDDEAPAVELDLTPADMLVLSFADTDLAVAAAAWAGSREPVPSLRLVSLAQLKHPYSVDLFVERLASRAKIVLVRLLGGADYWRYGVDELAAAARRTGITLALVPGDGRDDPRLTEASTVAPADLQAVTACLQAGGPDNFGRVLRFLARWPEARLEPPCPVPAAGIAPAMSRTSAPDGPHVLLLFYRSAYLAADLAPIEALADALAEGGAAVTGIFVASLKDPAAAAMLAGWLDRFRPDVILNTTAFSARDEDGTVLDRADTPVLQAVLAGSDRDQWVDSARGLGQADLAMNVVLPEVDGRLNAGAISFKQAGPVHPTLEFGRVAHQPDPDGIAHAADLALSWATLRHEARAERRLAIVVPDYPGKEGRAGYAVGLDTEASLRAIVADLGAAGYDVGAGPGPANFMRSLAEDALTADWSVDAYRDAFDALPLAFRTAVGDAWGLPTDDRDCLDRSFRFRVLRLGKVVLAIQPDRGRALQRRAEFHDPALPPRHGFVAFHLWLRQAARVHALVQLGTHGTVEWLPGKSVALSTGCAPRALVGAVPVIYPFIVNNPGEAAQAKRRIGALTIGHLTPPLAEAGTHGDTAELEQLFDEYAEALTLDSRRARLIGRTILERAADRDLLPASARTADPDAALAALDSWLCDIKEARIGDGLHTFGRAAAIVAEAQLSGGGQDLLASREKVDCAPGARRKRGNAAPPSPSSGASRHLLPRGEKGNAAKPVTTGADQSFDSVDHRRAACGPAEREGLLRALDGRFVAPGPSGAPDRARLDVLPTGRNLFSVDPRAVPTRTAAEIGARMAEELCTRYAQDHGDWPRRVVLDLWGSATMRTGGDDLAQAFALLGTRPRWDHGSGRVSGFEILPLAKLGRARVDVTLRISGLFRDAFPEQIRLFDAAGRAVAALDEEASENPLAEAARCGTSPMRIFGTAPGHYGIGIAEQLAANLATRKEALGQAYLEASAFAFGTTAEPVRAPDVFRQRVATANAFSHTTDLPGQDVLETDALAEHLGGFAAAAALAEGSPALYHADASRPDRVRLRPLNDAVTEALHARATNPRWIRGQLRHGHRGVIALAETLDALYTLATTTAAVPSGHFDRYFDATLGDEQVRSTLIAENPAAARDMGRRFTAAIANGYWTTRRNSVQATLDELATQPEHGR